MESIIAAHPNVKVFYKCKDGNVFLTYNAATGHCKSIGVDFETIEIIDTEAKQEPVTETIKKPKK